MSAKKRAASSVFDMPRADLQERVGRLKAHVQQGAEELPGSVQMPADRRRTSKGKLKGGEAKALRAVLAVAAAYPESFQLLGQLDDGDDPQAFEADLLLDRLDRLETLAPVVAELEALQTRLADTLLRLGELVKPAALRAYEVAKPLAAANERVATLLAPATDFYGAMGRKAARTRSARKQATDA